MDWRQDYIQSFTTYTLANNHDNQLIIIIIIIIRENETYYIQDVRLAPEFPNTLYIYIYLHLKIFYNLVILTWLLANAYSRQSANNAA